MTSCRNYKAPFNKATEGKHPFVDKTLFIKDLADSGEICLITRPHGFGKSFSLDMLRAYLDKNRERMPFFQKTAIWSCGDKYREMQGAYPVIYFPFGGVCGYNWEQAKSSLQTAILAAAMTLFKVRKPRGENTLYWNMICKILEGTASWLEYENSLKAMTALLHASGGRKPVVLVDEYDSVLQAGMQHGYCNEALDFITHFLSAGLKSNSRNISFAVITGTLPALSNSSYGGANNINVHTITDFKYSRYFGFTPEEVKELLKEAGHEDKYEEVFNWYGGYTYSGTLFRPESVIRYIQSGCVPHNFGSSCPYDIEDKDTLAELLSGKSISALLSQDCLCNPGSTDIWSCLAHEGYLVPAIGCLPRCVSLFVPNEEARQNLASKI
ncbi:MAG: AAA family ATPase [Clostridia bacterium]|nr:AAA family ATPase [Clostridia bacterium]